MSGGSYDYISYKLDEAVGTLRTLHSDDPHVLALAEHLRELSQVMHDIEWADSGDTSWDDALNDRIRAVLAPGAELDEATRMARRVYDTLGRLLVRVDNPGGG